ncbi:hypothetical protein DINM_004613 [Dirofilaria immitis]|nr:hypothetical protein [Dirofilaria immitis]
MELERPKKFKHLKSRELSPPPPVLTIDELEERFTDADERQPSTSKIENDGRTKEIESSEEEESSLSINKGDTVKSDEEELGKTISKHKSSINSEEINKEKIVESNEMKKSGMKKEENMKGVISTPVPVDSIYPTPATFPSSSLMDSEETLTVLIIFRYRRSIYPSMQLNEIKAASSQKVDELSLMTYSERIREHDITDVRQPSFLSSEIQNEITGDRIINMYPTPSLECNEYGLLTENQLLSFYQNELYENVEDFVDEFLELVKGCAQASWTAENRVIKQEGRCGEQKYATGSATYLVATFHPEKATELSRLLKRDVSTRLDSLLSLQIQMRSLALQIQWRIVDYNNAFMVEHCCNVNSPPCFLPGDANTVSRRNLRNALSDLFHSLRYPDLPSRFTAAVSGWISELVAVLLKACTSSDQQYLLCQVLRLVSPGRENFLRRIMNFENETNTWVIINDDGVEKDASNVTVSETDLIAFFNQFSVEAVFAKVIRCFAITLRLNPFNQALTLIAFELVLIKIFNDGLYTYGTFNYRQFCKQIGYALHQSIKCSAEFLKVIKDMLSFDEAKMMQKEFDRIILHAIYYIEIEAVRPLKDHEEIEVIRPLKDSVTLLTLEVQKNAKIFPCALQIQNRNVSKATEKFASGNYQFLGLLQFMVNLPYDFVSETCRMRCQILLRRKVAITVSQLYELPDKDLANLVEKAGSLFDKLPDLPSDDRIYIISALAAIISASDIGVDSFIVEILNVCFLDVSMRDHFYKAGAETVGILLDKHPHILQKILLFIDRNLDSWMKLYAVEILSIAPLSKCRLSIDDVGVICGKWLINKPPNHPASRIARRVLGSMNWGTDENGMLWLHPKVHAVCADTLVKGHMAQCKATNGLISKSWNKISKLASKVPDYEHHFDSFCWDILVRLKLPLQSMGLAVGMHSESTIMEFTPVSVNLKEGLSLWSELITSGCYVGSVVILARLVSLFPDAITTLISQEIFIQCFDRLLLCDISSYAVQLIAGADKFPGPTIRLLGSAITWNTDKSTLYLLGIVVRIAFIRDQTELLGIPKLLKISYTVLLQQWKDGSKSVLSWFASDDSVPPLIDSTNLSISPWASFALLLAEQQSHEAFYEALYLAMNNGCKIQLMVRCVTSFRKAASKSHVNIPVERLHFYRWLQFGCNDNIKRHPIFPLILQNLAIHLYSRKVYLAAKFCFGEKYLTNSSSKPLFEELREKILPQMEYSSEKGVSLFYKAFTQWLSNPKICNTSFRAFNDLLLDHLLQFIIANDFHPWLEYMNLDELRKKINDGQKLYIFACHLGSLVIDPPIIQARNFTQLISQFSKRSQALPYPIIPLHPTLPREVPFNLSVACDSRHCLIPYATHLKEINEAARVFVNAKDQIETLDDDYVGFYPDLYDKLATELVIVLKCGTAFGSRCAQPITSTVIVAASQYQTSVETKMKANRQERSDELANIYSKLFEQTSLHCANLENIALKMHNHMKNANSLSAMHAKLLHDAGRVLFYHSTSSITSLEMIFPAAADSYGFVLAKLGKAFIADNSREQHNLMRVILNDSHLTHLLKPYFTPHCVPPDELFNLYTSLSKAVRNPTTSLAALALLSQLDIKNAGDRLPPHQFSQLMPAAFENLISISDTSLPLYDVCAKHFIHSVFHQFPSNFVDGLKLSLVDQNGIMDTKPEYIIDAMTAIVASETIAIQFRKSRNELSTRLYSVWTNYLPKVLHLVQFFLYKAASLSFDCEWSIEKLRSELQQIFGSCVQVFGPLLEPFDSGLPPWNSADTDSAAVVLDHFVSLMEQLHQLYDSYLPCGPENLITLFWRYYVEKLAFFTRGGSHVHQIIESRFINIPWHLFWPNSCDLALMDKIMVDGAPESAPLITQIVVRIPWLPLIQQQEQQSLNAHRTFYSLLFSLLASCISQPANYAICRASFPKLMNSLRPFSWHLIDIEQLNMVSSRIASSFSSSVLIDPNDVTNAFSSLSLVARMLYRRVCFLGTFSIDAASAAEICQKQSFYVRTQLALMLRNPDDRAWLRRFYEDQIKVVHNIFHPQTFLSRELTSFWSDISDNKFLGMGLCKWSVVLKWTALSDHCRQILFTSPSSENTVFFLPLCANVFIMKQFASFTLTKQLEAATLQQENTLLRTLLDYITTLKPKYVTNEAAFLLLMEKLQKLLLRQMRYVCHLMNLYITQQTITPNQPPRNALNALVLNSRIQSFKELCVHKQYAQFQGTSQLAQSYFIEVQHYHIAHMNELFSHVVRSLYNEKYLEEMLDNAGISD